MKYPTSSRIARAETEFSSAEDKRIADFWRVAKTTKRSHKKGKEGDDEPDPQSKSNESAVQ